jgi:hypothetical protein
VSELRYHHSARVEHGEIFLFMWWTDFDCKANFLKFRILSSRRLYPDESPINPKDQHRLIARGSIGCYGILRWETAGKVTAFSDGIIDDIAWALHWVRGVARTNLPYYYQEP